MTFLLRRCQDVVEVLGAKDSAKHAAEFTVSGFKFQVFSGSARIPACRAQASLPAEFPPQRSGEQDASGPHAAMRALPFCLSPFGFVRLRFDPGYDFRIKVTR